MQYDIKATQPLVATGSFLDQNGNSLTRSRLKSVYIVCGASAGSVVFTNGPSGETLLNIATPAVANCGWVAFEMPGEGILAGSSVYGTVTNAASAVLFYG